MSSESTSRSSGGTGFLGLLAIVFIALKLTHVITWSWWWVTAPLWGGFALFGVFMLSALLAAFIAAILSPK